METEQPVAMIGGGGHASVLYDCLRQTSSRIVGVFDAALPVGAEIFPGVQCLGNDNTLVTSYKPEDLMLVNGAGSVGATDRRRGIFERLSARGYRFKTILHPSGILSFGSELAEGAQVMAGAIVQSHAKIGRNTIINTGAQIDHHCIIGDHVHVAPGAVLSGAVQVGDGVHIGTGARVIQEIRIGEGAIVGAGVTVLADVPPGAKISAAVTPVWTRSH